MARRLTGIAMLALEALLLWRTMGYLPVAVLAIVVALLGCWPRLQVDWGPRKRYLAAAVVGAIYLAWWWLDLQFLDPSRSAQFGNSLSLAAALCLMMIQALQYFWRLPQSLPGYFPFIGILALAFAADRYLTGATEHTIAFSVAMGYGLLMGLFYAVERPAETVADRSHRWYRYTLLAVCFGLSFLLAGGTAWVVGRSDRVVGQWLAQRNLAKNTLVLGNRNSARLSSMTDIKGYNFDHIALQIVAEESPGYLRGQVYDTYQNNAWGAVPSEARPEALEGGPDGYAPQWRGERIFPVREGAEFVDKSLVVYPDEAIDRAMFTPAETGWAAISAGDVLVSEARALQSATALKGRAYQVLTTLAVPVEPLPEETRARYLELPDDLAPRLRELSADICGERRDTLGKANAVTQYFTSNYDYVLGIEVPRGMNPMEYFLFSDPLPDAHCEFFATGAALLLRAAGVPARYVTGVGVWEQHPFADYWVARNRDAHAWVEAWDESQGWFIVEATPASGLPEATGGQRTNSVRDFWSMVTLQLRRLIAAIRDGAWPTVVVVLHGLVLGGLALLKDFWWVMVAVVAVLAGLWYARRRWRGGGKRSVSADAHKRRLEAQLTRMDRWVLKRHRQQRADYVTPHAFASTLEQESGDNEAAHWYRNWALARYRGQLDGDDVAALDDALEAVQRRK